MSIASAGDILAEKIAQFKQTQADLTDTVRIFEPKQQPILIKPAASSWETLEQKLKQVINFYGVWIKVRRLYDQGYGAELETAIEIALAKYKKSQPYSYFATMVNNESGNWETRTLRTVHETWEARRHTREVMDKLKLKPESTNAILALAWRLKGSIMRFLGIATEQGTGVRNAVGLFFALTKKQPTTT
jgi:hypothetical protein